MRMAKRKLDDGERELLAACDGKPMPVARLPWMDENAAVCAINFIHAGLMGTTKIGKHVHVFTTEAGRAAGALR
jgi:hypothetical protein